MTSDPRRLRDSNGPLGQMLQQVPSAPELTPAQLDRIRAAALGAGSTSLLTWLVRKSGVVKLIGLAVLVAGATLLVRRSSNEEPLTLARPVPAQVAAPSPVVAAPPEVAAVIGEAPQILVPPPRPVGRPLPPVAKPSAALVVEAPASVRVEAPVEAAVEPVVESEEVLLLGQAHLANQAHDGPRALRQLELYRARFPSGMLSEEATLLEVEVRLAGHDESKALAVLDRALVVASRRRNELQLVRSELLASLGRCEEALTAFEAQKEGDPSLQERAWMGWAICQLHQGNPAPARAALEEYLRRFPRSPRRALAIELLKDN
jgi:hypothetical protein